MNNTDKLSSPTISLLADIFCTNLARFFGILVLSILATSHCQKPDKTPPLEFILLPHLRGLLERPTQPKNLMGYYDIYSKIIELTWEPSQIPNVSNFPPIYRIYLYQKGPPEEYYRIQDIWDISATNSYLLGAMPFSGNLYFVVTAHNGFSESLPSNTLELNVFNQ